MTNILVVAAHPDDEVLGCGGTILKHVENGDSVHLVFMADGVGSRNGSFDAEFAERKKFMEKASLLLGVKSTTCLGFPDNRMDSMTLLDVVQPLEKVINTIRPEIVYTHHVGDLNIDHQITHKAVMTACRPIPSSTIKEIYAFEVLSSTEWQTPDQNPFTPNVFNDVTDFVEQKHSALCAYEHEMRPAPHSRSFENVVNLMKLRGNSLGANYAEAFILIRKVS